MLCSSGPYHVNILPSPCSSGSSLRDQDLAENAKIILESEYPAILRKAYAEKHNAYLLALEVPVPTTTSPGSRSRKWRT